MATKTVCYLLMLVGSLASAPAIAQRLDEGRARPLIEGEVNPTNVVVLPQRGDPSSAQRAIDGTPDAITLRLRVRIADGSTRTDYTVVIKDKARVVVARYTDADFRAKGELWSTPVPGATAVVQLEIPGVDPPGVSLAVTGVISQRKPRDPMLSIIHGFDLETMDSLRLEKPEIFAAGLPVAKLSFVRDGRSLVCTGFMIDDDRMLTNEHCINTQSGCDTAVAIFGFVSTAITTDQLRDQTTTCSKLVDKDPILDVALIQLANSPGTRWGRLKLSTKTPSVNELTLIIQHPNGDIQHVSRKDCFIARYPVRGLAKDTDFGHECGTMGGSSGSPVLSRSSMEVVGLHHFGVDPQDKDWSNQNRAVRIELIRDRLGI